MFKAKKNYRNEIIFFVLMALICFMLFCFGKKKILAAENGKVNLDAWNLTDMKKSGGVTTTNADDAVEATLDYNSSVESDFKDIVIPTAADFKSTHPKLEKVWITNITMSSVTNNANKEGGSLKISDTGEDDNSINDDAKKVYSKSTDLYNCMSDKDKINSIDLSKFDTDGVTDMSGMFRNCSSLTNLDLSNFDTSQVTNMYEMFKNCSSLTNLDLSNFDTSSVIRMDSMFYNCSSLVNWDFLDKFDLSAIYYVYDMFNGCQFSSSDTFKGIKNFVGNNTQRTGYMYGMYMNCVFDSDLDLSNFEYNFSDPGGNYCIGGNDQYGYTQDGIFQNTHNLLYLDLSRFNLDRFVSDNGLGETFSYKDVFTSSSNEPLLITTDSEYLKNYDYEGDHRTLFTTKLKVDGKNVAFRVNKNEENVSYNADNTTKYINIYTTYTTTDSKETILKNLAKRLEEEKNNLIVANGCSNLEWQPLDDYDDKVGYSLAGTYVISFDGGETENNSSNNNTSGHDWSTIENSGGSSGGGSSSSSTNQDLIPKNESTNIKTPAPTKSKIPEKLRTRKYLKGYVEYDNEKIKPENYVTNAEFATVIYRLMNDGEEINYDKLKDLGVEKSDWFAKAVAYLIDDSREIIKVKDEKFNPNKNITGYEMLNIIHSVLKFYDADKNFSIDQDLNSNVTRAKMSEIIFKALERKSNPGQKTYSDLNDRHWAYKYLMDTSE